ncbi:MAG TPA: ribosome silencing factor [Ruminococcaceae bacterium]|nr:ribosome silencing factor [Oscillospiraceae bacterium]
MTPKEMVLEIAKILDNKKASGIKALEIKDKTTIGDYFVIATGSSTTQVKSLADEIEFQLKQKGIEPKRVEGYQSAVWVLLDYYEVIVHIFYTETRQFYSLERLWADSPEVDLSAVISKD